MLLFFCGTARGTLGPESVARADTGLLDKTATPLEGLPIVSRGLDAGG